ncbi:MAG: nucleoside deaminase, partial [Methylococcaceae bacterium]|nr:nucleoside deaminase [Methylococcaceae bacterium]
MNHEQYMRRAIELALQAPDLPFGAVIVNRNSGEIVAEGFNQSAINPIFHGEIVAINQCAQTHRSADWQEFDLYTTAEPCPMCQGAIVWAGIDNVY